MPDPIIVDEWYREGPYQRRRQYCVWYPDYWLDVFTRGQYLRLVLLRWLIERGRVNEWDTEMDRHRTAGLAADRLRGGRFAGRIGRRA